MAKNKPAETKIDDSKIYSCTRCNFKTRYPKQQASLHNGKYSCPTCQVVLKSS